MDKVYFHRLHFHVGKVESRDKNLSFLVALILSACRSNCHRHVLLQPASNGLFMKKGEVTWGGNVIDRSLRTNVYLVAVFPRRLMSVGGRV